MTIRSTLIAAAVAAAAIVGLAVAPGSDLPASAQTVTVPPTTPCEGCGPSNQPGDGVSAFAFPSHVCREMPDGFQFSDYWLTFGVGKGAQSPARFEWDNASIMGEWWVDLGWVQPGRTRSAGPLVTVAPGQSTTINVRAFDQAGNPVRFGDRSYRRTFVLTCPCDQPSPPSSVTPPPASTAPGTTVVPPDTAPPSGGTTPTLPATGGGWAPWAPLGAVLILLGGGVLLVARCVRDDTEHER